MSASTDRQVVIFPVLVLLFLAGILVMPVVVSAHGDEDHDEASSDTSSGVVTMPDSTPSVDWDSLYAIIQEGYLAVRPIFRKGCYDCHSDQTRYPWYYSIPGVKTFMNNHMKNARKHLDLSNGFPFGGHGKRRADDLITIRNELEDGEMPLLSYRLLHWNAKPSAAETDSIFHWIDRSLRMLAAHGQYPFGLPAQVPGLPGHGEK